MYVQIGNNSDYHVRVVVVSSTGTGEYRLPPRWWIWSGFWTTANKFMVVFDAQTGEPLTSQIIHPQPNYFYELFPYIPSVPGGSPAPAQYGAQANQGGGPPSGGAGGPGSGGPL